MPNYRTPQIQYGGCAVNVSGKEEFHASCYTYDPSAICKTTCDSDRNCKGFVMYRQACRIATNSSCVQGYHKDYSSKAIGELVKDSTLVDNRFWDPPLGCFIKELGNG